MNRENVSERGQLASRARRRVQGNVPVSDVAQREVVDAFIAAAREGDFQALIAVLDLDVVLRADVGAPPAGMSPAVRRGEAVARAALSFSRLDLSVQPALINGAAGTVSIRDGEPVSVAGFTVRGGRIAEIDILADRDRPRRLDLTILDR